MRSSIPVVEESSMREVGLLIAVVQKIGLSCFDIEDHLAEYTISPAKSATVVNSPATQKLQRTIQN